MFSRASALLFSGLLLCLTFVYPYSGDTVLFAYITDLFLRGVPPYAGAWDHAFPGVMLVHVLQLTLFGKSTLALHTTDILFHVLALSSLYSICQRLQSHIAGWSACISYAIYYVTRGSNMVAITDAYVACILIIALDLAFRKRNVLSALLFGLTIVFRPTYGLLAVIYALWLAYRSRNLRDGLRAFTISLVPPLLLITAFGASGHFDAFFESVWTYNVEVYNRYVGFEQFFGPITHFTLLFLPALLGVCYVLRYRRDQLIVLSTLIGAILSLLLLIHAPYQYPPLAMHLALLAGLGWGFVVGKLRSPVAHYGLVLAHGALLFFYLRGTTLKISLASLLNGSSRSLVAAQSYFEPSPLWGITAQQKVADFLTQHTHESDRVQGLAPLYPQFIAGVLPSNRFIIPLSFGIRPADGKLKYFQIAWRREYINDLQTKPPKYYLIADSSQDARPFLNGLMPHEFIHKDFTELGALIDSSFTLDTVIGSFYIYRYVR